MLVISCKEPLIYISTLSLFGLMWNKDIDAVELVSVMVAQGCFLAYVRLNTRHKECYGVVSEVMAGIK